jgi:2-polyprenyl-6-hydroxyphenyl methylase/3-demethylubiquinone-9 3-methyltransferase
MAGYYEETLSGERLKRCYDLAPPAAQRYLAAEIKHVQARIEPGSAVLELGCGYGRVLREIAPAAGLVVGIDTSSHSLRLAGAFTADQGNVALVHMNAIKLAFLPTCFDLVCCVQNGISAFGVDPRSLLGAAVRVTRPGGRVLFSSYAEAFWPARLAWFRLQAAEGLVGEIDEAATGDGTIVCKDGFRATTVGAAAFRRLARGLGAQIQIEVVAGSSLFCEIQV